MLLSDHLGIEEHLFSLEDAVNAEDDIKKQLLERLEFTSPSRVLINVTRYRYPDNTYSPTSVYLFVYEYGVNFRKSTDVFIENHIADAYAVNTIELKATLLCT